MKKIVLILLLLIVNLHAIYEEYVTCQCSTPNSRWIKDNNATIYIGRFGFYTEPYAPETDLYSCVDNNMRTYQRNVLIDGGQYYFFYDAYQETDRCVCTQPSDPTPPPPEDTNTTHWELMGETSCKDDNATLPAVCTDANAMGILIQTWNTGCCGENKRCYVSTPVCDQNDTTFPLLKDQESVIYNWTAPDDLSAQCTAVSGDIQHSLVSCVDNYRCTCPYTPYPKMADNEEELFNWAENSSTDRSAECTALGGRKESSRVACTTLYRCVKETQTCPTERNENISSYVSPRDGSFHEDIALSGTDFGLHYNSAEWNSTKIAHGWAVSSHAWLEGNRLHYGSGSVRVVDTSTLEDNLTVVLSNSSEMLFDADGKLQNIRDLYTKETKSTFGYDNMGRLVTLSNIYGEISTIERDSNGTVTAIVAPTGQRTLLSIDSNGDLVEVQYEDTSSYAFEYEKHLMTVETEPNGNRFLHFFDDSGNVVKVIDAEQGEWNFSSASDTTQGSHTVTRASGDVVVYTNHFLENNATTLSSQKLLPTGDVVRYTNALDDSQSSTTSCGMETVNIYRKNADGTLYRDPYTHKRELESSRVTTPSGLSKLTTFSTNYSYDANSTLLSILHTSRSNGISTFDLKDYVSHTSTQTSAEGRIMSIEYNASSELPIKMQYANLKPIFYTYDNNGRVIKSKQGRRVNIYSYDERGNLQVVHNLQRDTKTTYSYDLLDRVIQTTYDDGSTEHYNYDANGNLITRTIPTPAEHSFTYNGVNKRTGYISPEQKQTTYTYDKQRRVTKVTKPSGKTIDTTYTNGRVTSVQTLEGTIDYRYSCQKTLSLITNGDESITFTYDGTLLTTLTQSGMLNQTLGYSYDNDLRVSAFNYADKTAQYAYDKDGLLISSGDYILTRDAENGLLRKVSDGLFSRKYDYNQFGEVKRVKDNLFNYRLKRAKARIVKKIEVLHIKVPKKKKGFKTKKKKSIYYYQYDNRNRLVEVRKGKHKKVVETYTYDANGNRASATVNGKTITASYTLDDNLVVYGDNTYLYDDDGYLAEKTTPKGTTTYSYGTMGELLSVVTPTQTITYRHNANNQRVLKEVNGTTVEKYLWANLTTLLATYDINDNLVQRFEYTDSRMPVAMTDANDTKYYLHYDQVGSLRTVTDTSHNIVKEIVYDTYGNILSDSNPSFTMPFGFAGGLYDQDTKLTRFGYRDYDAYTGKWTAKDPIGFSGGDSNLYGYVLGDPVGGIDPMGLSDIDLTYGESPYSTYDTLPWNNPNDKITIGGHGCATGIPEKVECDEDHIAGYDKSNIENLANQIRNLPKYQNNPNMPILLQVCYAGSTNLPQILANLLGRNVGAYSGSYYPGLGIGIGYTTFSPTKQE